MSSMFYLRAFCVFCSLNFICNIFSIAQEESLPSSDCPNIVDCLFTRNATRVQQFIDEGVNINIQNPYDNTLLILVADYGYADMVTVLLNGKADPDIRNIDGSTALMAASRNSHLDIVNLLIEAGADY